MPQIESPLYSHLLVTDNALGKVKQNSIIVVNLIQHIHHQDLMWTMEIIIS